MKKNEQLPITHIKKFDASYRKQDYPFYEITVEGEDFMVIFLNVRYFGLNDQIIFNHELDYYDIHLADFSNPETLQFQIDFEMNKTYKKISTKHEEDSILWYIYSYPTTDFILCAIPKRNVGTVRNFERDLVNLTEGRAKQSRFVQYPKDFRGFDNKYYLYQLVKWGAIFIPLSDMTNQLFLRDNKNDLIYRDALADFVIKAEAEKRGMKNLDLSDEDTLRILARGLFDESMVESIGSIEDSVNLSLLAEDYTQDTGVYTEQIDAYITEVWENLPAFISKYI